MEVQENGGPALGIQIGYKGGGTQFTNGGVGIVTLSVAAQQARDQKINRTSISANGEVVRSKDTREGDPTVLVNLLSGANGLITGIVTDDWGAVIQAVANDTNSNVLALPYVTTMDNEEAFFIVGQEVPIITGTSTGADNNNPFNTVDRQEVGIKLKITPQVMKAQHSRC